MINISNVTKRFGQTTAIDHFTLELADSDIYCLLGRNGAGKTTLMNLIAGKIAPSEGVVSINGKKTDTLNMPKNVEYIETAKKQFNMGIIDLIKLADGVNDDFDMDFALKMVEKFKLDKKKKYNSLSFGMKTMVTTLISLANNNDIVLLDEPVLGLDAIMRAQFYALLQESFTANERIIVVSTHLIDEIADVAGQVILIDKGKLIFNEDINTISEKAYKITGLRDDVEAAAKGLNIVQHESIGKYECLYVYDKRIPVFEGIDISNLALQELFVKMIGGADNE
ncbi:MAG: ABC transporter ATP-binding protein [Bacillota bacterium]|nr:ABC transporter ATP-binding protein [Bacillota bacterium]